MQYLDLFLSMAVQYAPRLLLALLTLWVGMRLLRTLLKIESRVLTARHVDQTVVLFLESTSSIVLQILLFISVATMVGIGTTSFIAVLGAATLAIGLSLQGSLSNIAGGLLILFLKHMRVGDEVEAQGQRGAVEKIEVFYTVLRGPDGRKIIIPNGALSNGVIVNHSGVKA